MQLTRRFIEALEAIERDWNIEEMVSLYRAECDVSNAVSPNVFHGRDGARDYWRTYRGWFGEVESSIHRVISSERHAAIEWSTRGTTATGRLVAYEGVTMLDFEQNLISRCRAYFNPAQLERPTQHAAPICDAFRDALPDDESVPSGQRGSIAGTANLIQ